MAKFARFVRTKTFKRDYEALPPKQKAAADELFERFQKDPFAKGLGTHKIIRESALRGEAVWCDFVKRRGCAANDGQSNCRKSRAEFVHVKTISCELLLGNASCLEVHAERLVLRNHLTEVLFYTGLGCYVPSENGMSSRSSAQRPPWPLASSKSGGL